MLDSMIITTAVVLLHTSCPNFKTNLHLQTKDQRIYVLENQNNKVSKYNRNKYLRTKFAQISRTCLSNYQFETFDKNKAK